MALRYFRPGLTAALIVVACAVATGGGLWMVSKVHAAARLQREVCRLEVEHWKARHPLLRAGLVEYADACRTRASIL